MKIILAQKNPIIGDIEYNQNIILETLLKHPNADLIIFPELFLTGYPPEDLLLRTQIYSQLTRSLTYIQTFLTKSQLLLIGTPRKNKAHRYNSCAILKKNCPIKYYDKQALPNDSVFDEKRYFSQGRRSNSLIQIKGKRVLIAVCRDLWGTTIFKRAKLLDADLIVSLNASPFYQGKHAIRLAQFQKLQAKYKMIPIVYVNCVGAQDELIFDGNSFILDPIGTILLQLPAFKESCTEFDFGKHNLPEINSPYTNNRIHPMQTIYDALTLGIKDYFDKNNFKRALIGLSGGIDSAVTTYLAVQALGSENVTAIAMPSQYSSMMSKRDAQQLAVNLGISFQCLSIQCLFKNYLIYLQPLFFEKKSDVTEENLQARIRGTLLMALSNKHGHLILTTSNKSEFAVGYSTLYGDTVGAFAPIKDLYKTDVYHLAKYINRINNSVIPENILTRAPSAELRPDQSDQDQLPPYAILDPILRNFIENNLGLSELQKKYAGHPEILAWIPIIIQLVKRNEYKRRQSPLGPKITSRAFGRDWRYPITENYCYD